MTREIPVAFHVCSFTVCPTVTAKMPYEEFRSAVLRAGRFSAFEATETPRAAKMFTRLCADPWIDTDKSCGYPWTRVKARLEAKPEYIEIFECPICKGDKCRHRSRVLVRRDLIRPTEAKP